MFDWLWKIVPNDYKYSVAFKKAAWTLAKTSVALLAGTKIGQKVSIQNWAIVTDVSTVLLAGGMKLIHDWAKMKWPDKKWL